MVRCFARPSLVSLVSHLLIALAAVDLLAQDADVAWRQLPGPYGSNGIVRMYDLGEGGIFALTANGLFHSLDNGTTWRAKTSPQDYEKSNPVIVRDSVGHLLFADRELGQSAALFRSTDGGESWTPIHTAPLSEIRWMCVGSDGAYYLGDLTTMFRSTNRGFSWSQPLTEVAGAHVTPSGVIVASRNDNSSSDDTTVFLRSADNGESWDTAWYEGGPTMNGVSLFSIGRGGVIYASDPYGLRRIYASYDTGSSWRVFLKSGGWSVAGTEEVTLVVTRDDQRSYLLATRDSGTTWDTIDSPLYPRGWEYLSFVTALHDGSLMVSGKDGPYISRDAGRTWTQAVDGIVDLSIMSAEATADAIILGTSGRTAESSDGGDRWTVDAAIGGPVALATLGDGTVYAVGGDTIRRREAGGSAFGDPHRTLSSVPPGSTIAVTRVEGNELIVMAARHGELHWSIDKGATWSITPVGGKGEGPSSRIYRMEFDGTLLYVASDGGLHVADASQVLLGTMPAWTELTDVTGAHDMAVGPDSLLAVVWAGQVGVSGDRGRTWTYTSPVAVERDVAACHITAFGEIFASVEHETNDSGKVSGIYRLDPTTGTWHTELEVRSLRTRFLDFFESPLGNLYVVTDFDGVFERAGPSDVRRDGGSPHKLDLSFNLRSWRPITGSYDAGDASDYERGLSSVTHPRRE